MTTRENILSAINRLAAERPGQRLTVAAVAATLGVSRQSVYRHVGGKAQLATLQAEAGHPRLTEDTRSRLLAAASRAFARLGYAGATLDEIAAEAGLTKGAVYWHFANKNELFLEILEWRLRQRLTVIPRQALDAARAKDPVEEITALLLEQLAFAVAEPDWPKLYLEYLLHSGDHGIRQRLDETALAIQRMVAKAIGDLQGEGLVRPDLEPMALAVTFTAILDGLVLGWLRSPDWIDFDVLVPTIARVLWEGMQRR